MTAEPSSPESDYQLSPQNTSLYDGSGQSRWGYVPARGDSVQQNFRDVRVPTWEKVINVPWKLVAYPLGWINDGIGKGINSFAGTGVGQWVQRAFRKVDVPYGVTVTPTISGFRDFEWGFTLYHNEFLDPRRQVRLGLKIGGQGTLKVYYGSRFAQRFDWGIGYRRRGNARYFGIGPETSSDTESYYTERSAWLGFGYNVPLGRHSYFRLRASYNAIDTGPPISERGSSIEEVFAGNLPKGYDQLSRGLAFGFVLRNDNTTERARPQRGGIRRLRVEYFTATSGDSPDYWTFRGELQQFLPLWYTKRALCLRGFMAWIEPVGDGVLDFQRLYTNDDPDLLRGFIDYRWRDQGMLGFSVEYRWPGWALREVAGTGVDIYLLSDIGQVYGDLRQIALRNLTVSWGFGLRLLGDNQKYITRLEFAWSDEDFVVRLRSDQLFQYIRNIFYYGRRPIPAR